MHKISYIGDGQTYQYSFAFSFFQDADVVVAVDNIVIEKEKYSVIESPDFNGGFVIFVAPPDSGATIDIFRQISLSRVIDYQPTAKIDPEHLNSDFNFLLEAFKDLHSINVDIQQWSNIHDNVMSFLKYTNQVVEDKLGGGAVLGLYKNLLSVLDNALPDLINDYGFVTEVAPNENRDDYGLL